MRLCFKGVVQREWTSVSNTSDVVHANYLRGHDTPSRFAAIPCKADYVPVNDFEHTPNQIY